MEPSALADVNNSASVEALVKKNTRFIPVGGSKPDITYGHWQGSKVISNSEGGKLKIDKFYSLKVAPKSMTRNGHILDKATISGIADLCPDGSLIFHFQPSGLQFDPPAQIEINWHKMGVKESQDVNLLWYNPENAEWVTMSDWNDNTGIYKWHKKGKKISFYVNHFSFYSISKD